LLSFSRLNLRIGWLALSLWMGLQAEAIAAPKHAINNKATTRKLWLCERCQLWQQKEAI
jgi:hypothetical protein